MGFFDALDKTFKSMEKAVDAYKSGKNLAHGLGRLGDSLSKAVEKPSINSIANALSQASSTLRSGETCGRKAGNVFKDR